MPKHATQRPEEIAMYQDLLRSLNDYAGNTSWFPWLKRFFTGRWGRNHPVHDVQRAIRGTMPGDAIGLISWLANIRHGISATLDQVIAGFWGDPRLGHCLRGYAQIISPPDIFLSYYHKVPGIIVVAKQQNYGNVENSLEQAGNWEGKPEWLGDALYFALGRDVFRDNWLWRYEGGLAMAVLDQIDRLPYLDKMTAVNAYFSHLRFSNWDTENQFAHSPYTDEERARRSEVLAKIQAVTGEKLDVDAIPVAERKNWLTEHPDIFWQEITGNLQEKLITLFEGMNPGDIIDLVKPLVSGPYHLERHPPLAAYFREKPDVLKDVLQRLDPEFISSNDFFYELFKENPLEFVQMARLLKSCLPSCRNIPEFIAEAKGWSDRPPYLARILRFMAESCWHKSDHEAEALLQTDDDGDNLVTLSIKCGSVDPDFLTSIRSLNPDDRRKVLSHADKEGNNALMLAASSRFRQITVISSIAQFRQCTLISRIAPLIGICGDPELTYAVLRQKNEAGHNALTLAAFHACAFNQSGYDSVEALEPIKLILNLVRLLSVAQQEEIIHSLYESYQPYPGIVFAYQQTDEPAIRRIDIPEVRAYIDNYLKRISSPGTPAKASDAGLFSSSGASSSSATQDGSTTQNHSSPRL